MYMYTRLLQRARVQDNALLSEGVLNSTRHTHILEVQRWLGYLYSPVCII